MVHLGKASVPFVHAIPMRNRFDRVIKAIALRVEDQFY